MRDTLLHTKNLDIKQEIVTSLILEDNRVKGVETQLGNIYRAEKIIITAGTFLNGLSILGETAKSRGDRESLASIELPNI